MAQQQKGGDGGGRGGGVEESVDYMNLPCPIPYEDFHHESLVSLKPELFEGMRIEFIKPLNPRFFLSHNVTMGPIEIPCQSPETIKVPTSNYEFGANFLDPKLCLIGRMTTDGKLNARVKWDLTDNLTIKGNAQLTSEPHMSNGTAALEYKGSDYRAQFHFINTGFSGANYIQSVTPRLSFGSEVFWSGEHRKSGFGGGARYSSDKTVAAAQVATTGMLHLSYVHKASEKVSLATELMYNYTSKDAVASVGYDCNFRQARVRGKIDSNGCAAAYLEEKLQPGLLFILSGEVDHRKKDYKFGFGFTVGGE